MPLPSISLADVKQGANKARSVGVAGFNSARTAVQSKSSTPSTSTGYRPPVAGAPPPPGSSNARTYGPPPQRAGAGASASPRPSPARPPLPQRSTSASTPPPPPYSSAEGSPVQKRPTPPLPQRSGSTVSPPLPQRTGSAVLPPLPIRRAISSASQAPAPSPPPAPRAAPPPTYRSRPPASTPSPSLPAHTPSFASQAKTPEVEIESIDWARLTPGDKDVFFGWLDEFFERYLVADGAGQKDQVGKVSVPPSTPAPRVVVPASAHRVVAPSPRMIAPAPSVRGPPRPNLATKPSSPMPVTPAGSYHHDLQMSYPPASINDSQALDIAMYFHPQTPWTEPWYETTNTLPPPLQNNGEIRWRGSTMRTHATRTFSAGVLFADLSMCWFAVSSPLTPADPNDTARVTRSVQYTPRPAPLDRDTLLAASAAYGELVATFAEGFAGTGHYCARGECWDLAHHALEHAAAQLPAAPPVPSLSRTHGHLLFEGTPAGGRWRGGDDRVRRGDIVEWRRARVDLPGGASATLGDPDHTAVVVDDAQPVKGERPVPGELGTLVVVEQSVGSPPERKSYPMRGFVQGEVWIYRPVGMEVYTGVRELEPTPPPGLQTMKL